VWLNLVELRATKGGEVAAFRRSFRLWAFLTCGVVDWRAEERKGARGGLKWGIGAYGERQRGAGRVFGAVSRRPWGVWWVFGLVQLYGGAEWRLMDV